MIARALALFVVVLALAGCGDHGKQHGDLLITAARIFDGTRFESPGAVLIRGDRIVAAGSHVDATATKVLRFPGSTILPGFIDLHVHGGNRGTIEGGDTTIRNVGEPLDALRLPFRALGVRVLAAGPLVTVPGGYPTPVWGPQIALDVTSPTAAKAAVRMLKRRGAAVIKIALDSDAGQWPMLTVAEVRAIVSQAHALKLRVTAHAFRPDGVGRGLAGGVDELAHVPCGATDAQVHELARRRVPVVSTLHVEQVAEGGCEAVAQQLVRLGVRLLYGTDYGNPGIPIGIDVAELRLMRQAGMSTEEVLAGATSRAGAELGRAPLGLLGPGAPADVIVTRGDGRTLPASLARPVLVVTAGRIRVDRR